MEEVRPYVGQLLSMFGILVPGTVGTMAAVDTGEAWRFAGTGVFLVITLSLYIWRYHLREA